MREPRGTYTLSPLRECHTRPETPALPAACPRVSVPRPPPPQGDKGVTDGLDNLLPGKRIIYLVGGPVARQVAAGMCGVLAYPPDKLNFFASHLAINSASERKCKVLICVCVQVLPLR